MSRLGLLGLLVLGCKGPEELSILGASAGPLVTELKLTPATPPPPAASAEAAELRRDYRAKDMILHPCASWSADGAIVGKDCAGGFVVFGPYVAVPANAELRVELTIEASEDVVLSSDIASDLGRLHHGGLRDQPLPAGRQQSLRYQAHVQEAAQAVEARLMISAAKPVDFRITSFVLSVR